MSGRKMCFISMFIHDCLDVRHIRIFVISFYVWIKPRRETSLNSTWSYMCNYKVIDIYKNM